MARIELKEVPPLPHEFCEGCFLNGCYPWSDNPLFRCSAVENGLSLSVWQVAIVSSEEIPRSCVSYHAVTDETWVAYLTDRKKEAKNKEEYRLKVTRGEKIMSNNP